jgi:acetylglutamate kinase
MGLSGRDDSFLMASRLPEVETKDDQGAPTLVSLGRVGRIESVRPGLVRNLISNGFVPVIAPIAIDPDGHVLNVNADTAAGRIAESLEAAKLILMTDVEGVNDREKNQLSSLSAPDVDRMIHEGIIVGGMIPKVQCALDAVSNGVEKAHIIDGRRRHALLLEIFTDRGVGTEIHAGS